MTWRSVPTRVPVEWTLIGAIAIGQADRKLSKCPCRAVLPTRAWAAGWMTWLEQDCGVRGPATLAVLDRQRTLGAGLAHGDVFSEQHDRGGHGPRPLPRCTEQRPAAGRPHRPLRRRPAGASRASQETAPSGCPRRSRRTPGPTRRSRDGYVRDGSSLTRGQPMLATRSRSGARRRNSLRQPARL